MIRLDEQRLRVVLRDLRTATGELLRSLDTLRLGGLSEELKGDLLTDAIRHASLLEGGLGSLLDLTDLAVVDLSLDLQEVDLHRLARHRLAVARTSVFPNHSLSTHRRRDARHDPLHPLIADSGRLARMIDLAFQVTSAWARPQTTISVVSRHAGLEIELVLDSEIGDWHETWWKGRVDLERSALEEWLDSLQVPQRSFRRDTVQSLQLIHSIALRHGGQLRQALDEGRLRLIFELPLLAPEEALQIGLEARLRGAPAGIAQLSLILLRVDDGLDLLDYGRRARRALLRASDSIFPIESSHDLVLLVNDCNREEVEHLLSRIVDWAGEPVGFGSASCPAEGLDADELLRRARRQLDDSIAASA